MMRRSCSSHCNRNHPFIATAGWSTSNLSAGFAEPCEAGKPCDVVGQQGAAVAFQHKRHDVLDACDD
jgi:hypothetical protein